MAVNKIAESASFSIEVRKGTDSLGNPTYSKKSFSNVKSVLSDETRNVYMTVSDQLVQG